MPGLSHTEVIASTIFATASPTPGINNTPRTVNSGASRCVSALPPTRNRTNLGALHGYHRFPTIGAGHNIGTGASLTQSPRMCTTHPNPTATPSTVGSCSSASGSMTEATMPGTAAASIHPPNASTASSSINPATTRAPTTPVAAVTAATTTPSATANTRVWVRVRCGSFRFASTGVAVARYTSLDTPRSPCDTSPVTGPNKRDAFAFG
ncbi:hypothetical protein PIS_066 [Saccharomonospora phage PIS 136]|nr:hypothetical protein PIS_066 [Saccharomonospora phage PIS 136]